MNERQITELLNGNPRTLVKIMESSGFDFNQLDKNIAREMVQKKFELTQEEFDTVDFVFWVTYFAEKMTEELIIEPGEEINFERLYFTDKIKIVEERYTGKNDPLITQLRKVRDLRNHVAHGRIKELIYDDYPLSDVRGRIILIGDLRDSLLNKD